MSNDKRDIYSEFKMTVEDALKTPPARILREGGQVDAGRQGGVIRLPSGKMIIRDPADYSMPLIGKRYLLFLKYDEIAEDFHIITGYQLEGNQTYSLDDLNHAKATGIATL